MAIFIIMKPLGLSLRFMSILSLTWILAGAYSSSSAQQISSKNLIGHGGPVNSVSISPDGQSALSGSLDYAVMQWNLTTAPPISTGRFIEHSGAVSVVEYFPSGKQALSAGDDGALYLWDLDSTTLTHKFEGHQAKVVAIDITADSSLAASASWDGTIRLWDLTKKSLLKKIKVHEATVNSVLISADKQTLYSGGHDGKIRAWESASGGFIHVSHDHGWPINIMRWLPDKQHIVFGTSNGDAQILDVNTRKISKVLIPHEEPVLGLAVSSKYNLLATGGNDGAIRVWSIDDWSLRGETHAILGPVWALAFAGDGRALYFGSLDDDVKFWQIAKNDQELMPKGKRVRRFQVSDGKDLGEIQFLRKCSVCHTIEPGDANRAGPSLHKLFGRQAGSLPGYVYSDSLLDSDIVWDEASIDALFTKGPEVLLPGTKMPLQKVSDAEKRKALIDYLKRASES